MKKIKYYILLRKDEWHGWYAMAMEENREALEIIKKKTKSQIPNSKFLIRKCEITLN